MQNRLFFSLINITQTMTIRFYNSGFLNTYSEKECSLAMQWLLASPALRRRRKRKIWFSRLVDKPRNSYLLGGLPKGTYAEQYMYLKLSSYRNYFDYIESRVATLPLSLALDDYSKLQIITNRLLKVHDEKIYFKNERI